MLRSTFHESGFDSIRSTPHGLGRDAGEQRRAAFFHGHACHEERKELIQRLQSPFEADLPRRSLLVHRGERHHTSDEIVRQQVHLELITDTVGSLAAQPIHAEFDF